jgi:hypothetical protein
VPTTREQLASTLARHDGEALALILRAAQVDARGATTSAELGARIADAIWWNYNTPLGYLADRGSFEHVVRHLAERLGAAEAIDPRADVWTQLDALTGALAAGIPDDVGPGWSAPLGWASTATGSFGARWASARALALLRTPLGRLLPALPVVGPAFGVIRTGVGAVYAVSGPLGLALTLLSIDSAMSTNYQRLVPLVLGVGGLPRR